MPGPNFPQKALSSVFAGYPHRLENVKTSRDFGSRSRVRFLGEVFFGNVEQLDCVWGNYQHGFLPVSINESGIPDVLATLQRYNVSAWTLEALLIGGYNNTEQKDVTYVEGT